MTLISPHCIDTSATSGSEHFGGVVPVRNRIERYRGIVSDHLSREAQSVDRKGGFASFEVACRRVYGVVDPVDRVIVSQHYEAKSMSQKNYAADSSGPPAYTDFDSPEDRRLEKSGDSLQRGRQRRCEISRCDSTELNDLMKSYVRDVETLRQNSFGVKWFWVGDTEESKSLIFLIWFILQSMCVDLQYIYWVRLKAINKFKC